MTSAKAASGALDLIPIVAVPNLARALDALKERGFLTVGLDSEGETDLSDAPLRLPPESGGSRAAACSPPGEPGEAAGR